jgi:hypothetical protein
MPGNSSWMSYAPQGVKGFDDDDDDGYDVKCCSFFLLEVCLFFDIISEQSVTTFPSL